MSDRIHLVVDKAEKERYRRQAEREGLSLSEWLRKAARRRLEEGDAGPRLDSLEDLRAFFAECDLREEGREPDWEEHLRVIEGSIRSGGESP